MVANLLDGIEVRLGVDYFDDKEAYDAQAKVLAKKFVDNFKRFENAPADLIAAGPVAE